jgi:uncharacterized protein (TIGR02646 family)
MPPIRAKAKPLTEVGSITLVEHNELKARGALDASFWATKELPYKNQIQSFRQEIKNHYFWQQARRCCYCSFELQNDHSTFDAEHILDQSKHRTYMFEPENMAASCKRCNKKKSIRSPLSDGVSAANGIPKASGDYKIVHPHLDEWDNHLTFDEFDRIVAIDQKGSETIDLCGISILNVARLCDYFDPSSMQEAEKALRALHVIKSKKKKEEKLQVLRRLADDFNLAKAKALVLELESDLLPQNV